MTYEPRVGDLVTTSYGAAELTASHRGGWRWRLADPHKCAGGWMAAAILTPLRPDAPGQRVRGEHSAVGAFSAGVTTESLTHPTTGAPGFFVRWDAGGRGPWQCARLIRIADQAPTAPVEAPRPETPPSAADVAALDAAIGALYAYLGPTCQHCGSGIVAGLLRDACPRGCDLTLRAAEPEPENVGTMGWHHASESLGAVPPPSFDSFSERVWVAEGRGKRRAHPTREGAIAAWREAVRR